MRSGYVLLAIAAVAAAQTSDVADAVAQVKAMRNPRDGAALLERAIHFCEAATPPNQDCADAFDWYGMVLQTDAQSEALSRAEPFYRRALELRGDASPNPGALALSLELESVALKATSNAADATRAELLWTQAQKLRADAVQAIDAAPLDSSPRAPALPLPPPMDKPGNGVSTPTILSRVDPAYSEEARLIKCSGTVLLSLVVDTSGRANAIQLKRGVGFGLDEKAAESVRKWVFRPAANTRTGNPVEVRVQIEVNFRLL